MTRRRDRNDEDYVDDMFRATERLAPALLGDEAAEKKSLPSVSLMTEEEKVLPAVPNPDASMLARAHALARNADTVRDQAAELLRRPINPSTANLARDLREEAKTALRQFDPNAQGADPTIRQLTNDTAALNRAHKFFTGLLSRMKRPLEDAVGTCDRILADCIRAQQRKEEERRRQREQAHKEQQERERAAQIEHLSQLGNQEAAQALAAEPPPPIFSPPPAETARIDGLARPRSVRRFGTIVDAPKFVSEYLMKHPEDIFLFEPRAGAWKQRLANAGDQFQVPGARIDEDLELRSTRRSD
jgi:hypothetical protein